jgi:hypothetical protein
MERYSFPATLGLNGVLQYEQSITVRQRDAMLRIEPLRHVTQRAFALWSLQRRTKANGLLPCLRPDQHSTDLQRLKDAKPSTVVLAELEHGRARLRFADETADLLNVGNGVPSHVAQPVDQLRLGGEAHR